MFSSQKRKRTDDLDDINMSDSSSNRSNSTSPPASDSLVTRHFVPIGVHSRTMKRWRNDRPSEEDVHNYTLQKLFSAQHREQANRVANSSFLSPPTVHHGNPSSSSTSLLSSSPPSHTHSPSSTPPSSFSSGRAHSFFSRPQQQQPQQQASYFPPPPQQQQQQQVNITLSCSDCDRRLDVTWDEDEWACKGMGCIKYVCSTCSIGGGDVGTERVCLDCAMCR